MKKAVKIAGIAVLALVALVGVLSLLAKNDKNITIVSTEFVKAPTNEVFDQIRYMRNFPNWSPYLVTDPNQKYKVTGNDGALGATFHWEGVDEEGIGSQTIVDIKTNQLVKMRCDIITPFEANPEFTYTLTEKNGGVEVAQAFNVEMPFPANVFSYLFGLRDEMRKTNELGLARLKEFVETGVASTVSR